MSDSTNGAAVLGEFGQREAVILPRLSLMMLLQYAVWGAWLPVAARYLKAPASAGGLGFDDGQIGMILGLAGSIGAVSAPFIAGQFADRYFRTERFMAFLLILGGALMWMLSQQRTYNSWLGLSIAYSVVYMPTLALSNSLAFAHVRDANHDFPKVRVWGTIGWIAASWAFPMIWLQNDLHLRWLPPFLVGHEVDNVTGRLADSLRFSAMLGFVYALYCLTLPATPPKRDAVEKLAFAKAFGLFRRPSFAVLVLASLAISTIHQVYFLQTSPFFSKLGLRDSDIGPAMTIGQFSEIIMIALLGTLLRRIGFRWVMAMGTTAYVLRYAIWGSSASAEIMVISQVLHGFCYACFFAASYIYVDRIADADVRHSAQTVYGIVMLGGGPVLGGFLSGWLGKLYTVGGVLDYTRFWNTIALIGLAATLFFVACFREDRKLRSSEAS